MKKIFILYSGVMLSLFAYDSYNSTIKKLMNEVYTTPDLMYSFYCKQPFRKVIKDGKPTLVPLKHRAFDTHTQSGKENIRAKRIEWEHIVPVENFLKQIPECRKPSGGFLDRASCAKVSPKFKKMLADPMNIVPAIGEVNGERKNYKPTGDKIPKYSKHKRCGIHIDKETKRIHVSDRLKGQIARTYLYMSKQYGMKLSPQERAKYQEWNRTFPETAQEKSIKSKKQASIKKYKNAKAVRQASASIAENTKPKSTSNHTLKKPYKTKLTKLTMSITQKALLKGSAKGLIAGVSQYIPYIGVATQIAWDAYIGYQLEIHTEKIKINEQNIQTNRNDIKINEQNIQTNRNDINKLVEEQEILNIKIEKNSADIIKAIQLSAINKSEIELLTKNVSDISWDIKNLKTEVEQNREDIHIIKDTEFQIGINKLNEYYQTDDKNYLSQSISQFEKSKALFKNNIELVGLIDYYLVITKYEDYIISTKEKDKKHDFNKMKESYKELADLIEQKPDMLGILNSLYVAVGDLDNEKIQFFKTKLKQVTQKVIENKISQSKFDDALDIAQVYTLIEEDNNNIYKKAYKAKQDNFDKYKNFTSVENALEVINKNQNTLLNKMAIRFFAKERSMNNALILLKTKRLDDENLRIKGLVCIYNYLNNQNMVKQIQQMIQKSHNYSQKMKDIVLNLQCQSK